LRSIARQLKVVCVIVFPRGDPGETDARNGIISPADASPAVAQIANWQGRSVYAFTRSIDTVAQEFARRLGAVWAGASDQRPDTALDAAIIYAPAREFVPAHGAQGRKGGVRRDRHE
jgi:alcohol dehydrogenase, propanol-preferring